MMHLIPSGFTRPIPVGTQSQRRRSMPIVVILGWLVLIAVSISAPTTLTIALSREVSSPQIVVATAPTGGGLVRRHPPCCARTPYMRSSAARPTALTTSEPGIRAPCSCSLSTVRETRARCGSLAGLRCRSSGHGGSRWPSTWRPASRWWRRCQSARAVGGGWGDGVAIGAGCGIRSISVASGFDAPVSVTVPARVEPGRPSSSSAPSCRSRCSRRARAGA